MPKVIRNRTRELVAVKERKEGRRISQRVVADETGVSLSAVASWMRNDVTRMDAAVILAFMTYFNCSLDELLVIEDDTEGQIKTPLPAA